MAPLKRSGVTGHVELIAALRELSKGPTETELDAAARKSLDPMVTRTREGLRNQRNYVGKWRGFPQPKSPRKGGHVDQGIVMRKSGKSSKTKRIYRVGATKRARYLLHLLEFGTAPHFQPKFRGGWMHPGARAHPVLIPTFDEEKGRVPKVFAQTIWAGMSAKIARLKKAPARRGKR